MFLELQYGEIEEMNVCDNLGDHLVGNVYVKFRYEEDAEKAVKDLDNRWYNGELHIWLYIPIVRCVVHTWPKLNINVKQSI